MKIIFIPSEKQYRSVGSSEFLQSSLFSLRRFDIKIAIHRVRRISALYINMCSLFLDSFGQQIGVCLSQRPYTITPRSSVAGLCFFFFFCCLSHISRGSPGPLVPGVDAGYRRYGEAARQGLGPAEVLQALTHLLTHAQHTKLHRMLTTIF